MYRIHHYQQTTWPSLHHCNTFVIPRDWKVAKQDPKWREAMIEELNALERNKTWELVHLPAGKRAVGCKWIYTVKQNPEGKLERYKARLVARGYSQIWD